LELGSDQDNLSVMSHPPSPFTRRNLLTATGAAALMTVPGLASAPAAESSDSLQAWFAVNASAVRSVDFQDEDFSDLQPLAAAIGTARVVQLGEPSHNAGTCFAAKARIIRFLHQHLGFDVLVWESGIYDVGLAEAALRGGEEPSAAAQRGILRNWAGSEECRPLFAYAQRSHATARPLVMAGFDSSLTSPFANLAAELRQYVSGLPRGALRGAAVSATEEMIQAFAALTAYIEAFDVIEKALTGASGEVRKQAFGRWEQETGAKLRPNGAMLDRFKQAETRLAELLRVHDDEFARVAGARRSGFMRRVVGSLNARAANLYEQFGTDVPASSDGGLAEQNRRDAHNAENLRWLIEQGYPGRKMVVWAHNAHIMNAYYEAPGWKTISLDPVANGMKPHGVFLADWLGRDLYTIGFTAYSGTDGFKGLSASPIPPARDGSVEARLRRLGRPYLFVDLRVARGPRRPLKDVQVVRVPKYDEVEIGDVTRPYDGLFFIADMGQARLIPS
jgi:erythromycin esterase